MWKFVLIAIATASLALPSVAFAQPVFLICKLVDRGGESVFDVQLNEEAGTVSYVTRRNQMAVKKRAIFTPQAVSFGSFEIDRRSLAFRRDNTASAFYAPSTSPAMDVGSCEVSAEKRAF